MPRYRLMMRLPLAGRQPEEIGTTEADAEEEVVSELVNAVMDQVDAWWEPVSESESLKSPEQ